MAEQLAEVIPFPIERAAAAHLTKRQLAETLGYSKRWVELAMANEAMPYHRTPNGEARFILREILPWLDKRKAKVTA